MGHVLKQSLSKIAGADLSAKQFYAVKLDSAGKAILCSAAGEWVFGVLGNKPTSGQAASVDVIGVVQVIAGGVIVPGGPCKVSSTGKMLAASLALTDASGASATAALVGSHVIGRSMMEANTADGDIFDMLITREGAIPTTAA